ncbi:hypothetical protein MKY59_21380 [Paenibacillus sp. FSL W8-0426]|uniref:hypothetical protein n=1 Tax=Paenibacillus sp. FSL W8-0426 TaxID=2921714 RepID=UPI0030D89149
METRRVVSAVSAIGDRDIKLDQTCTDIVINNNSGSDITFSVANGKVAIVDSFVLRDGQSIEWFLNAFDRITVTASGFYQVVAGKGGR